MLNGHTVTMNPEEAREVAGCLRDRRDDMIKEKARAEKKRLETGAFDKILAIHHGDGATTGLATKFLPRDNVDMFEEPQPIGDLVVTNQGGKLELSTGAGDSQLHVDIFNGKLKACDVDGGTAEDEDGNVFSVNVVVSTTFEKMEGLCQKVGCRQKVKDGSCIKKDCPQKAPPPEKPKTTRRAMSKMSPSEAELANKVEEGKRTLAIEAINGAVDMDVPWRRKRVQYALEAADLAWLTACATRKDGEAFPDLPDGWEPETAKDPDDPTPDYEGLKFSPAAQIFAVELAMDRKYLEGYGSGTDGKLTKGDVEDAVNRRLNFDAAAEREATAAEQAEAETATTPG